MCLFLNNNLSLCGVLMDEWINADVVAELETKPLRTIQWRAQKGKYSKAREVPAPQGGGKDGMIWQIHFSCLAPPAQAAYLRRLALKTEAPSDPASCPVIPKSRGEGLLRYQRADDQHRELGHIKKEILDAFERSVGHKRGPRAPDAKHLTQAEFCRLYNEGAIKSLSADVYTRVPHISVPTLHSWRADQDAFGLGGLVRKEREAAVRSLTQEQQDFILGLVHKNPIVRPVRIHEYLRDKFGKNAVPHPATIYRFMERWKLENRQLYDYLLDPSDWKNRHMLALGDKAAGIERFCQRWEADSTPADIICSDKKRYTGVGLIDVFSRLPAVLIAESSKATAVAAILRKGMLGLGGIGGIPEELGMDHGKDYDSKHIDVVCNALNIAKPWIPPRTPEGKPFIERFWGTLAVGLFEELPGFSGHNVAERQAMRNREKARDEFVKAFLTHGGVVEVGVSRDELQEIMDRWIDLIYSQRPHKGLNGAIPADMPGRSPVPVRRVSDERVLDILLAPPFERTIQKKGIELERGWFQSLDMGEHVGKRVRVQIDLTDAARVYVFDLKHRYLFTAIDSTRAGFTPEQLSRARKSQAKKVKAASRALKDLKADIGSNPMMDRLDDLEAAGRRIAPIVKVEEFDNAAVSEAKRAVADQLKIMRAPSEEEIKAGVAAIDGYRAPAVVSDKEAEEIARKALELDRLTAEMAGTSSPPSPTREAAPDPPVEREGKPFTGKRPIFGNHIDRYRWSLERMGEGFELTESDMVFIRDFESRLDEEARGYWDLMKETLNVKTEGC